MSHFKTKYSRQFGAIGDTWSTDETNSFLLAIAQDLARSIQHVPTRDRVTRDVARCDIRALCDLSPAYAELSADDSRTVRQVSALFSKRADLDLGVDRRSASLDKFVEAENLCKETNTLFELWSAGRFQFRPHVERALHSAQRKISTILGEAPHLADLKFRFGPGATTTRKKQNASAAYKLADPIACSASLLPLAGALLRECPGLLPETEGDVHWAPVELHDGRLSFVPKNWKTDRAIVVEPMLNTFYQLGLGDYIADRLRRCGLDISDQSKNQRLARIGSLTGGFATIDLSSASDTLAKGLVAHLLPVDWYSLLLAGRSPYITYTLAGAGAGINYRHRLEKFSSMGNGFTFPLETLIFYAITLAVCEDDDCVRAYGDDIICPSWAAPRVMEVLEALGFVINQDKSFWFGAFRESCGCDYVLGYNVRPVYVKDRLSAYDAITLANGLKENGFERAAISTRRTLHPRLRLYGPSGYGDGYFHIDNLHATSRHLTAGKTRARAGFSGYFFKKWLPVPCSREHVLRSARYPVYQQYLMSPYPERIDNPSVRESFLGRKDKDGIAWVYPRRLQEAVEEATTAHQPRDGSCNGSGAVRLALPGSKGYRKTKCYVLG